MSTKTEQPEAPPHERISPDYCPSCHIEGADYTGGVSPLGVIRTKKSLPAKCRFWVECDWCGLRTSGGSSADREITKWNTRHNREQINNNRLRLLGVANYVAEQLSEINYFK